MFLYGDFKSTAMPHHTAGNRLRPDALRGRDFAGQEGLPATNNRTGTWRPHPWFGGRGSLISPAFGGTPPMLDGTAMRISAPRRFGVARKGLASLPWMQARPSSQGLRRASRAQRNTPPAALCAALRAGLVCASLGSSQTGQNGRLFSSEMRHAHPTALHECPTPT